MTFSVIFLNTASIYAAWGNCPVKDAPAAELKNYTKDLQSLISATNSLAWSSDCWQSWSWILSPAKWSIISAYESITTSSNKIFNFSWYMTSWSFNVTYPLFSWEIPQEFYNDHDYVQKQTDKLNQTLTKLASKCALDKLAKDNDKIKTIAQKYWFKYNTIKDVLIDAKTFNEWVTEYFRCTVVWDTSPCFFPSENKTLTNSTLQQDIDDNYWKEAKSLCVQGSKSYKKLSDMIDKITNWDISWFMWISKGIQIWKDAIDLLMWKWIGKKPYSQIEKELLAKELKRQWLKWSQIDSMISNLNCFNNKSWLEVMSCYKDSFMRVIWPIWKQLADVWKSIMWAFSDPTQTKTQIVYKDQSDAINKDIWADYAKTKAIMSASEVSLWSSIASLVQLHQSLESTIIKLTAGLPVVKALCNCNWKGDWNCNF